MAYAFEGFQNFGKDQLEAISASSSSLSKSLQTIVTESSEYSKKTLENGSAFFEKLLGAKSFESALQIQSEHARAFFDGFVGYVTKTGEVYSNLAKETLGPIGTAMSKVQTSKE
jgi:hypothetical protein